MAESSTAVALIFDDVELGGQLREALRERGARIVHEGALSTLSRSMLDDTGAQVLVVNLDEEVEDELDRLYDVIDGDHPRVVFNDAQASRRLDGWDRARWARHLAVKVMAQGDLDPPRPQDAPSVPETAASAFVPVEAEAPEPMAEFVPDIEPLTDFAEIPAEPVAALEGGEVSEASETLAAELEALLAADEPQATEDDFGSLKFVAEDELPPLHDGHFGVDTLATQGPAPVEPEPPMLPSRAMPSFQLDHLSLSPLDDSFLPSPSSESVVKDSSSLLGLASGWSLVSEEEGPAVVAPVESVDYGIEKLSAAEFLAPEGGNEDESFLKPGMTLELVSI
ncbi:MAG: chemotaxis protein CheB, partial [Dyella sp.]|nr:chemotaxis protein CheB [Dyella sp.]